MLHAIQRQWTSVMEFFCAAVSGFKIIWKMFMENRTQCEQKPDQLCRTVICSAAL